MANKQRFGAPQLPIASKLIVLACAAVAYASHFWPNKLVLGAGLQALGNPAYEGFAGVFLPHLLLYSTLPALVCALLWFVLNRLGLLMPVLLGRIGESLRIGIAIGLISLAALLAFAWLTMPAGTIHWIDPQPWKIAGNLFSNFYEEFIFRGFILMALMAVFGFWPAAVVSSVAWAALHTQYPLDLQAFVAFCGLLWAWAGRRARSLWAPYTAHMTLDVIGDCLIG